MTNRLGSTTGYEQEWEEVYGKEKDPVRNYLIYPALDQELEGFTPKYVVDAGCGNGGLLSRYKNIAFKKAKGIDLSPSFIDIASKDNNDKRIEYLLGDLTQKLKVEDSWADLIFSVFVLNEIRDLSSVFAEFHRILAPNGKVLIILTHPFQLLIENFGMNKSPKLTGDTNYFEENELVYHFSLSNATARYYHHNFEHLTKNLNSNNLLIKRIRELTTNDSIFEKFPNYWEKRAIPLYMILDIAKAE